MHETEMTLTEILEARDRRETCRRELLSHGGVILIQLGVNIPGSVKNNAMILKIFREGVSRLEQLFGDILDGRYLNPDLPTGPEGFFTLEMDPLAAKNACIPLENNHILGRLWDIDIYKCTGVPVSRSELNLPPRSCYLCGESAHSCTRSSKHSLEDLLGHIAQLFSSFESGIVNSELQ